MNDKLENKLSMYLSVEKVMNDNEPRWAGVPKMVSTVNSFRGEIASIASLREVQEENLKGITIDKEARKIKMANIAFKVAGAMVAYADDTGNNELKKNIGYTLTELLKPRDTTSKARCTKIYNKAVPLASLLSEYGITSAVISELQGAITAYGLIIEKPRTAKAMAAAAGKQMKDKFRETDSTLKNKMDKLMLQYKDAGTAGTPSPAPTATGTGAAATPPAYVGDFYMQYVNAREIIDLGKRTFHEKEFEVAKGEVNKEIADVVDQKKLKNTGHTILAWRDSGSDEPIMLQPGEEMLMNTPTGKIIVQNRDENKEGKVTVVVYKRDAVER